MAKTAWNLAQSITRPDVLYGGCDTQDEKLTKVADVLVDFRVWFQEEIDELDALKARIDALEQRAMTPSDKLMARISNELDAKRDRKLHQETG
jgi:hypothetical protein